MSGESAGKRSKKRTWLMPQEVEVWYVLPALRRELARMMITKGTPQKHIARILGVTEPAITQYKLEKSTRSRGDQIEIPDEFIPEIEKAVDRMLRAWHEKGSEDQIYQAMTREINRLIKQLRTAGTMCKIHREYCQYVDEDCNAC